MWISDQEQAFGTEHAACVSQEILTWVYQNSRHNSPDFISNQALDLLPCAVAVFDGDGCVRHWNHAAEDLFGWSRNEVVGTLCPIFGTSGYRLIERIINQIGLNRHVPGTEILADTRSGSPIRILLGASPLRSAGYHVPGILVSLLDNTRSAVATA